MAARTFSRLARRPSSSVWTKRSRDFWICCRTPVGRLSRLCRSSVKSPSPMAWTRRATTSSAARFSATNSTRRPSAIARPRRLAMVCDFPVPGGPSSTKVRPLMASATADTWEPSAGMGHVAASASRSSPTSDVTGSRNSSVGVWARWWASGAASSVSQFSARSFHSRNFANCSSPRPAVASTRNGCPLLTRDSRTPRMTSSSAMPLSSRGGLARVGSDSPKDNRSFSRRQ